MPTLIHCKTVATGLAAIRSDAASYLFHCPGCYAGLQAGIPDRKDYYYHCPSCGAVFNGRRVLAPEEADRMFPDEIF